MSVNNSYMFGTQQRNQNSNPIDRMQQFQCTTHGKLDLSKVPSNMGPGDSDMSQNVNLQLQQLLMQAQQQQLSTTASQIQSIQQLPAAPKAKKPKEPVLKTPLSLLNEVCAKAKTAPVYALEESGPVHLRVYKCLVKVDTHGFSCEANANGKTKKDAKQNAAKELLMKLDNDVEKYLIPLTVKEEPVTTIIEVDPEPPGNPVGTLNDLCTKLKRLPPEYEDVSEIGKPHERVYTVACKLGSHVVETGSGRSKKNAKRVAAHRVHKRVLDLLAKESEGVAVLKDDDDLIEKLNSLTLVSKLEARKITGDWKLSEWLANLKTRSGPKLDQFKDASNTSSRVTDPMKALKEIADEQKLKLEFMELVDSVNKDSKTYLVAVSAGNQPVTVLMGSAESKTQAKKNAAETFMEMLKLVLTSA